MGLGKKLRITNQKDEEMLDVGEDDGTISCDGTT
jgi:hypothetical protein